MVRSAEAYWVVGAGRGELRSEELPGGEVKGPQADVGAGWWGKLYEEHGRGLLWKESGEKHVKADGWNEYVIEARGSRRIGCDE